MKERLLAIKQKFRKSRGGLRDMRTGPPRLASCYYIPQTPPLDADATLDCTPSTPTGIVPTAMLPRLPVEIWLLIIDELGAEHEYDALEACVGASEGLMKERAGRYVPYELTFRSPEEVARINVRQRWKGPLRVCFVRGRRGGERLPIPHLATLASRLAQKWTNVCELTIERAEWRAQDLDLRSLLLDLAYFSDIRELRLYSVTFPSVLTFWRFVCAFPNLDDLFLRDIKFVKTAIDPRAFSVWRVLSAPSLQTMYILRPDESDVDQPGSLALPQVIVAQTPPSLKAHLWIKLFFLSLWDVKLPTAAAFERLLCALPALQRLTINGPCTFPEHGCNSSDVPLRPGTLLGLTHVALGKEFSLHSDPQSVHDLVDLLIETGASGRLQSIAAWLSPSLRVATSIDVALNRLVKHAGQSLQHLAVHVLPQDNFPLFNEASTYAAPSPARCFDVSANTSLGSLDYSVVITHEGSSWIAPLLELLHQVTSHISHVQLAFNVMSEAHLAILQADLSHLDAALPQTLLDELQHVWTCFKPGHESANVTSAMVRSCLPKLDARGILHIYVEYPSGKQQDL